MHSMAEGQMARMRKSGARVWSLRAVTLFQQWWDSVGMREKTENRFVIGPAAAGTSRSKLLTAMEKVDLGWRITTCLHV